MSKIINPQIKVVIYTNDTEYTFIKDHMDVTIEKDLDEEPNEAEVIIHNLDKSNRQAIVQAGNESAPIEIYFTRPESEDFVRAFQGEISRARNSIPEVDQLVHTRFQPNPENGPGLETIISCTSQKENHRAFYIEPKNFAKGTEYATVINWLIDQVGLPTQVGTLPSGKTRYSYSMSGVAFPLLKQYIFDFGLYAYILDGKLYVTDAYSPISTTPKEMNDKYLITEPEHTTREDAEQIEISTVRLNKSGDISKKRRMKKTQGPSAYVSSELMDTQVEGREYRFICQPDIEPDVLISSLDETTRVRSVEHDCSNYGVVRFETIINADLTIDIL